MQHLSTFGNFQPINESWKDSIKKLLVSAGISVSLLTGCASEQAFMKKLEKEDPKKFQKFYVKKADGSYDLRPTYKKMMSKEEREKLDCGSEEADEKRAASVVGQKAYKKGKN